MLKRIDTPNEYLAALHGRATVEVVAFTATGNKSNPFALHTGLYNDPSAAERAACEFDDQAQGIYATVNSVNRYASNPLHLHRTKNRTSSNDVRHRAHWYLDVDAVRPRGQNTNDTEHRAALTRRDDVTEYLARAGGPDPFVRGDSGNSAYLVYRLAHDVGDTDRAHRALCETFSNAYVKLDPLVNNLDRLHPLAGTMKRKGPHTTERPQRMTWAEVDDNAGEINQAMIATLANLWTPPAQVERVGGVALVEYAGAQLPQLAIDFLANPPDDGERNKCLFDALRAMRDAGLSQDAARNTLQGAALAVGFTLQKFGAVLRPVYDWRGVGRPEHRAQVLAKIDQWRAVVIACNWPGRAGQTKRRVALGVAEIAERVGRVQFHASARDVGVAAGTSKDATANHLKGLRKQEGLLVATNLGARDTVQAIEYRLNIPAGLQTDQKQGGVTERTLVEPRGEGVNPASSTSVRSVTPPTNTGANLPSQLETHELATTKRGGCMAAIVAALMGGPLSARQLQKHTGRRVATCLDALGWLGRANLVALSDDKWTLTQTDPGALLSAFDELARMTNATGRREALRITFDHERELFRKVESALGEDAVAVCDHIREKRELARRDARERKRQQATTQLRGRVRERAAHPTPPPAKPSGPTLEQMRIANATAKHSRKRAGPLVVNLDKGATMIVA